MGWSSCIGPDEEFVWYFHHSKNEISTVLTKTSSHATYGTAMDFNVPLMCLSSIGLKAGLLCRRRTCYLLPSSSECVVTKTKSSLPSIVVAFQSQSLAPIPLRQHLEGLSASSGAERKLMSTPKILADIVQI